MSFDCPEFKVVTAFEEIDLDKFSEKIFDDGLQADPPCAPQIFPS